MIDERERKDKQSRKESEVKALHGCDEGRIRVESEVKALHGCDEGRIRVRI